MRAQEFTKEDVIDDDMADDTKRQARLKAEIEAGMMPTVCNCSSSAKPVYTCGDLEALGWMDKSYTHDSSGEVDGWERYYYGPKPFKLYTQGAPKLKLINKHDEF